MRDEKMLWFFALLAMLLLGAATAWFFHVRGNSPEPVQTESAELPEQSPAQPDTPQHRIAPVDEGGDETPQLQPLPSLDESDEYFKLELVDLFGTGSESLIVSNGLIERLVATIDNLPREKVSERIRPVTALDGQFAVVEDQPGDGRFTLDTSNYARYDALAEQFAEASLQEIDALYRRYYPLFQKAYAAQGYPDGYFNDRLVEVIDHLLATPEIEGPIELLRPHVMYQFADPELEALSGGQKLLLRLGPDNRARVEEKLRELRALIVDS